MASSSLELKNQLSNNPSPYLRAHSTNPVAWQQWDASTLALAKQHQRMIFLSVGYSACHWCHVMEKESFSAPDVADVLNANFIPIKLDRETRPDLDEIYMNFVTATTGSGGWPLNVFLTPDLKPVFGGTYWPGPTSPNAVPPGSDTEDQPLNFLDILHKMIDVWINDRPRCLVAAEDVTRQLQDFASEGSHGQSSTSASGGSEDGDPPEPLELDLLDDALEHFVAKYDRAVGGFSTAPKFPMPANLRFLLRLGASQGFDSRVYTHTRFGFHSPVPDILGEKSCATAASMALYTLLSMSRSGLRDHLGHGFHRYSVTPDWNLPHFEKMLFDNAELLAVYCDAWALGRNPEILGTIYDLVEYLTALDSPIVRADGGWYSSEDADSYPGKNTNEEKKEGAFYVWTLKELQTILGDHDASILARHFGVKNHGNIPAKYDVHDEFLNQNSLFIDATPSILAKEFGMKEEDIVKAVREGKNKLAQHRTTQRLAPDVDNKVIASWNGLAINALARAAATLSAVDAERAQRCRDGAVRGLNFIRSKLFNPVNGKLTRILNPQASETSAEKDLAFIDDYANVIKAAIGCYDLTLDYRHLEFAIQLQKTLDTHFIADATGGYYQAAIAAGQEAKDQILRLKLGTDNTTPSPNGIIASNLFYLAAYVRTAPELQADLQLGDRFQRQARATINAFAVEMLQHPFLYVTLLGAVVMDSLGVHALIVPRDMPLEEIQAKGLRGFSRTVVRSDSGVKSGEVMICTKDNVCRPLRPQDLDVSAI